MCEEEMKRPRRVRATKPKNGVKKEKKKPMNASAASKKKEA